MNTNFDPLMEPRIIRTHWEDLPKRLTNRFQRIFTSATNHDGSYIPNYQTITFLGEMAVVSGLVGTVVSVYFQSYEHLPQCLGNIAFGAFAIGKGLYR